MFHRSHADLVSSYNGWLPLITLGNTPNTDILVSDSEGNQFVDIFVRLGTLAKRSSGEYSRSLVFPSGRFFGRSRVFP